MGLAGTVGETTLSTEQTARHTHTAQGVVGASGGFGGGGTGLWQGTVTTSAVGGSQPHTHPFEGATEQADSLPPFLSFEIVVRVA